MTFNGVRSSWEIVETNSERMRLAVWSSSYKRAFVSALQRLVPALRPGDIRPGGAGVRAQAVTADGALVDDFRIVQTADAIHVLNAPSPAATASLAIGRHIATIAAQTFTLRS